MGRPTPPLSRGFAPVAPICSSPSRTTKQRRRRNSRVRSGEWSSGKSRAWSRAYPRAWDVTGRRSSSRSSAESSAFSGVNSGDGSSGTSAGATVNVCPGREGHHPLYPPNRTFVGAGSTARPQESRSRRDPHAPIRPSRPAGGLIAGRAGSALWLVRIGSGGLPVATRPLQRLSG